MNKMLLSFASGKPMVCNADLSYSEIKRRNLGIDDYLDTPQKYADAIKHIYNLPKDEYSAMCDRVRATASQYDIPYLMKRFMRCCEIV